MRRNSLLLAPLLAFVVGACSESHAPEQSTSGEIYGNVELRYTNGSPGTYAGVVVAVEGLTGRSDTTNDGGAYEIADVPPGTYSISFTKPGFGHYVVYGHVVDRYARTHAPIVELAEIPRATVTQLSAGQSGDRIAVDGTVSEDGLNERAQVVALYFGREGTVSNHPRDHTLRQIVEVDRGARTFSTEISNTYLRNLGIASGTTLHVVGYVMDYHTYTKYNIPGYTSEYATSLSGPSMRTTVVVP
jgi:hypothetical protein